MNKIENDLLKIVVLRFVCDDYESLETLFPGITTTFSTTNITREDVLQQLRKLVEEDLVTAFAFDKNIWKHKLISLESVNENSWFLATPKGIAIWLKRYDERDWDHLVPEGTSPHSSIETGGTIEIGEESTYGTD